MACPAAATCLRMPGSYVACSPIGKKIALVQCAASAASTAGVFLGQGPSSKVSPTSPSRRKSWALKCSKPKPGPPVVSISTTRATPKALGLLHEVDMAEGSGAACAAGAGDAWAKAVGAATGAPTGAAAVLSAALSATVTTEPGARPSVGVACAVAGADAGAGMEAFCKKMAPNTATHSTIASVDAIAARRMSDLQPLRSVPLIRHLPNFGPYPLIQP